MSFGDFVCLLEEETAKGAKEEAAETEEGTDGVCYSATSCVNSV
mgnify:CR=1 FL=1